MSYSAKSPQPICEQPESTGLGSAHTTGGPGPRRLAQLNLVISTIRWRMAKRLLPAKAIVLRSGLVLALLLSSVVWSSPMPAGATGGTGTSSYLPLVISPSPATSASACRPWIRGQVSDDPKVEKATLDAINGVRADHGLPPLVPNEALTQAARYHANDLADHNLTGHTSSNGMSPLDRLDGVCYHWMGMGEIAGYGYGGDVDRMMDGWMNSPGHRDIILSPHYTEFGGGFATNSSSDYKNYWTVVFGVQQPDTAGARSAGLTLEVIIPEMDPGETPALDPGP